MTEIAVIGNDSSDNRYTITNESSCDLEINSTSEDLVDAVYQNYNRRIVTIVIPLVVIFGVLGNATFLFVICRVKQMRNMTNFYLANLAIADVLALTAASIQYFWSYAVSAPLDVSLIGFTFETPFGCSIPAVLNYSCYFASIWFITLVATERFLAICHPFKHRMIRGKGRAFRLVCGAWLLSFAMGAFAGTNAGIQTICIDGPKGGPINDLPKRIPRCTPLCNECNTFLWAIDTIQFFIALMCNTLMYGMIIYILSARTMTSETNGCLSQETTRVRNQENRDSVARMLSINAIIFFVCLFPYMILNINSLSGFIGNNFKHGFEWVAKTAYLMNSASNPYIYSGVNKRYRQAFLKCFGCDKSRQDTTMQMSYVTGTISVRSTRGSIRGEIKKSATPL